MAEILTENSRLFVSVVFIDIGVLTGYNMYKNVVYCFLK